MAENKTQFNEDSSAVQTHLSIMQDIIQRMAENSRSCKTWCITIVSAVLVLVARVERPDYILIALAPAFLFLFLDTYYLALERGFRKSYKAFVEKLHAANEDISSDLYVVDNTSDSFFLKVTKNHRQKSAVHADWMSKMSKSTTIQTSETAQWNWQKRYSIG